MVWHWKTDKVAVLVAFRLQIIQEDMGIRTGPFCGCAGNTYEIGYDEGLWYSLSKTKNIPLDCLGRRIFRETSVF